MRWSNSPRGPGCRFSTMPAPETETCARSGISVLRLTPTRANLSGVPWAARHGGYSAGERRPSAPIVGISFHRLGWAERHGTGVVGLADRTGARPASG